MGLMSWSDDVRCLYCDGRLPLYRKISHGQFCSSAHRKAYWQEQERLAVERLHQTHDSLRSYRTQGQADPHAESAGQVELHPNPALAAAPPLHELPAHEPIILPPPEEVPLAVPAMFGHLDPELLPRGGATPELIAADP